MKPEDGVDVARIDVGAAAATDGDTTDSVAPGGAPLMTTIWGYGQSGRAAMFWML